MFELPPSVLQMLQGTGAPAPDPVQPPAPIAGVPGVSSMPQYDLPPSVMGMLGAPQPEAAPPIQSQPDYVAGVAAPQKGGGVAIKPPSQPRVAPPSAVGPPTLGQAQTAQDAALAAGQAANQAATAVNVQKADEQFNTLQQGDEQLKQIAADQKAFQDKAEAIRADKSAAVDAAYREVDNFKVDQNKYWSDASTGKKIGWIISMALSGLGDALQHKNGPNPVIEMLNATAAQSVQAQMDQRAQLEKKAGRAQGQVDEWDRFSANKDAQAAARLGQAQTLLAQQVQTAAAKYGSQEAVANGQKVAAELQKSAADNKEKAAEFALNHEIQKQQLAVSRGQLGVAQAGQAEATRHNMAVEDFTEQQRVTEANKAAKAGNAKLAEEINKRAIGGEVTVTKDKNGFVTNTKLANITNKDGSIWVPQGTEASVTELQKQHPQVVAYVQNLDKLRAMGPEWLSDIGNSDKKQQLDQIMGDLRLQAIALKGLGVPTGHDIELAENFIGTSNPTRWKDSLAGLMQSRETTVRDHNALLQSHGLDKAWEPADLGKKVTKQDDPDLREALDIAPTESDAERVGHKPGEAASQAVVVDDKWRQTHGQIQPHQERIIQTWGAGLKAADAATRDRSQSYLERIIADKDRNPQAAALAQYYLNNAVGQDIFSSATPERVR